MRNWTQHGFSRLTAISDAGSTPAASTTFRSVLAVRGWLPKPIPAGLSLMTQSSKLRNLFNRTLGDRASRKE